MVVYLKVFIASVLLGIPLFLLVALVEFGVKPEQFSSSAFWLSHPIAILAYGIVSALVVFLFQALGVASEASGSDKERGSVKWFSSSKGYGFITREQGEDVFVHYRSILGKGHRSLYEGQVVEFTVSLGDKGLQADDVVVVEDVKKRGGRRSGKK